MAVAVNTERKGVEISWDTGEAGPPTVEPPVIWGGGNEPFPTPPIEIPETPPSVPELPPDLGLSDEQKEKLLDFLEGNLPPYAGPPQVQPVGAEGAQVVQVFAQGEAGDWHNTSAQKNDGLAFLSYPVDFAGSSYVEVRTLDGTVVDSGTIEID